MNSQNSKNNVIKAAYGEYWDKVKDYIDDDGWFNNIEHDFYFSEWGNSSIVLEYEGSFCRPKSLSGIETNNGWISISLENIILPIDGTEVHFYVSFANENGIQREHHKGIFNAALGFTSYYDSERYNIKEVTHYQPIETPKPPIF
ncbi:hypothetical protein HZP35_18840 [Elizabethkingia anophelis]|nr:hypothetical protein [Elizabethkingia anophelis]MCT4171316.1 hypothetical protein [Elizabethkingia anophelis]MCT4245730.1 hypothetical protein [Elizabethkingia anophelis]MCT4249434.1 hypothetical protein [Elizabethkingia anophelis]MCT4260455.1 hypothetical protein [Elizabethkingia anophelis]